MAVEMTHAHNVFLRGLNSVYHQAPIIKKQQDAQDLFVFCRAWIVALEHHHNIEETTLFPAIDEITKQKSTCARERAQHKTIHNGLEQLEKYLTETAPEKYRWDNLKAVFDTFAPTLHAHLNDEIQVILSLDSVQDKAGLVKIWKQTEDVAKAFKHPRIFVSYLNFGPLSKRFTESLPGHGHALRLGLHG